MFSPTLIPPLLSGDGKLLVDSNDKAELLNETFIAKQSNEDVVIPSGCHPEPHLTKFAFRSRDVKKILDGLDSWGGEDPDGFIPLIFKKIEFCLVPQTKKSISSFVQKQSFSQMNEKLATLLLFLRVLCRLTAIITDLLPSYLLCPR